MIQHGLNNDQRELYATAFIRTYTNDVYVGPDIEWECLEQMVNCPDGEMVHLKPLPGDTRRVIVAMVKDENEMSTISKQFIPLCYAITQCVKSNNRMAVKWVNICDV
jgi:hypothetical protein